MSSSRSSEGTRVSRLRGSTPAATRATSGPRAPTGPSDWATCTLTRSATFWWRCGSPRPWTRRCRRSRRRAS
eukprot:jgi/Mesen1/5170/ME000256S04352